MSVLAHDLRTPLTAIRGATTLLIQSRDELDRGRVDLLLGIIESQAGQMADKVEDLLVVSRLDAGRLHLFEEDSDLGRVVAAALEAARRAAPGRRLLAVGVIDGTLVHADSDRIAQVLRILIDNAIRYSPEEEPVEIAVRKERGGKVRVEVRDRGPGIPPAAAEKVFERFHRLETGGHGSGLGLHVARGLARAMAGECGFSPRAGGGSVFWFTLPQTTTK